MDYSPSNRLFYLSALSDKNIKTLYRLVSKEQSAKVELESTFGRENKLSPHSKLLLILSMENIFNKKIYNNNIDDVRCMNSAKFSKDLISRGFFNSAKEQTQQEKYYDEKLRQFNGLGIIQVLNILYDVDHYKPPANLAVNPLFEQCLKYLKNGFSDFADRIIGEDEKNKDRSEEIPLETKSDFADRIIGEDEKNKDSSEEIPLKTKFRKIYDVFLYDSFKYEKKDLPLDPNFATSTQLTLISSVTQFDIWCLPPQFE